MFIILCTLLDELQPAALAGPYLGAPYLGAPSL